MKVAHRLLVVALAWWLRQGSVPTAAGDCPDACGGVSVPYPFGLEDGCASSPEFLLYCNTTKERGKQLQLGNITVRKISPGDSTMLVSLPVVHKCYDKNGLPLNLNQSDDLVIDLSTWPQYTLSDTRNSLTVLGCDAYALMAFNDGMFRSGCISYCNNSVEFAKDTICSGLGCCQASIPKGLKTFRMEISSVNDYVSVGQVNTCGVAFVGDKRSFNMSNWTPPDTRDFGKKVDAVLDWMIGWDDVPSGQAHSQSSNRSSVACGPNTYPSNSEDGAGYRCSCKDGYEGNPYDPIHGCQDVDECKEPQILCQGKCKNQLGSYTCECPFGMVGGGDVGCHVNWGPIKAAAVIIAALFFTSVGAFYIWRWRSKEKNFRRNGGELLKRHRVQIFTEAELSKATNNYDERNKLGEGGFGSVYKGRIVGDTMVAVKKPKDMHKSLMKGDFQHELETVMQINHKNVVKLHGICLETRIPFLVYEYISNGTLFEHIHQNASTILRSWKNRLRIAAEAALALDYLHSCAEPPIIHGDIKSVNILLDHNYSVKISDFGTSVFLSPDISHIVGNEIQGTLGYIDPEYLTTGMLTVKSDIYSFGVVLMELLTGKKPTSFITDSGESINIVYYFISCVKDKTFPDVISFKAAGQDEMERVGMVAEIAVKCLDQSSVRRPAMREVAEQLARIDRELHSSAIEENNEETEGEVDKESLHSHDASITSKASQHGTSSSLF